MFMQLVWNGYVMLRLSSSVLFYAITDTCHDVDNLSWKLIQGMLLNYNVDVIPRLQGHCNDMYLTPVVN